MRHEIINDINLTLRHLLEAELKVVFKNVTVKMADLENFKKGETKTGINVFLYAVTLNEPRIRTNQQEEQKIEEGSDGEPVYVFRPPSVPITLSFMLTPFATDPQTEYRLLGRIIQVFQENPVITGDRLKGEWLPNQGRIAFTPDYQFTFERQMEVFRAYDVPYKMSLGYLARGSMISDKVMRRSRVARGARHDMGSDNTPAPDPGSMAAKAVSSR